MTGGNPAIAGPCSADTIGDLKDRAGGGINVSGSATLVRVLLAGGLAGEQHLFVFPLAQGAGQRQFADSGPASSSPLPGHRPTATGHCT